MASIANVVISPWMILIFMRIFYHIPDGMSQSMNIQHQPEEGEAFAF